LVKKEIKRNKRLIINYKLKINTKNALASMAESTGRM
jgi:hypothetical protein